MKTIYQLIKEGFKKQFSRKPTPLEVAHNLPKGASDSQAMLAMVAALEDQS